MRSLLSSALSAGPNVVVASDKWTHITLVWNLSRRFLALHVDGQLTRARPLMEGVQSGYGARGCGTLIRSDKIRWGWMGTLSYLIDQWLARAKF